MTVAADDRIIKRRMDDYLWRDGSAPNRRLRAIFDRNFTDFKNIAIIGGMARDLARAGKPGFRSDVDMVIDAPQRDVERMAQATGAVRNRFGGYSFQSEGWKIEFWALETTWASRERHVRVEAIEDLVNCTFFDWDAILYDVWNRRVVCRTDYVDKLDRGVMDIELQPTPSVTGNLYRAVRRLLRWNVQPGPKLERFIDEHLDASRFEEIVDKDWKESPSPFLHWFRDAPSVRRCIADRQQRLAFSTHYADQMSLPGMPERRPQESGDVAPARAPMRLAERNRATGFRQIRKRPIDVRQCPLSFGDSDDIDRFSTVNVD